MRRYLELYWKDIGPRGYDIDDTLTVTTAQTGYLLCATLVIGDVRINVNDIAIIEYANNLADGIGFANVC